MHTYLINSLDWLAWDTGSPETVWIQLESGAPQHLQDKEKDPHIATLV